MKALSMFFSLILLVGCCETVSAAAQQGYQVAGAVRLTKNRSGKVFIELVTAEEFATHGEPRFKAAIPMGSAERQPDRVAFSFTDVPAGKYGIQAFHDLNDNDEFDFFLLFPAEPWGNYRMSRPKFRGPAFDDLAFEVTADVLGIEIQLE